VREGGEIADRIMVQDQAIACALGGADRRTLYMVIGRVGGEQKSLERRAGRIEAVRVAVAGAGLP
jgi:sugar lactone lactonase YvrE